MVHKLHIFGNSATELLIAMLHCNLHYAKTKFGTERRQVSISPTDNEMIAQCRFVYSLGYCNLCKIYQLNFAACPSGLACRCHIESKTERI